MKHQNKIIGLVLIGSLLVFLPVPVYAAPAAQTSVASNRFFPLPQRSRHKNMFPKTAPYAAKDAPRSRPAREHIETMPSAQDPKLLLYVYDELR